MKRLTSLGSCGAFFAILVLSSSLVAQTGNDNPTGTSGSSETVTTAGSYQIYTGNATRSVTDIAVSGGVGAYPLAFTRTMNSRYTPGLAVEFGEPGSWRHSYQWSIDSVTLQSSRSNKWTVMPDSYTVNSPDGRRVVFGASNFDPYMRAGPGVRERFQQPTGGDGSDCYLLLPDGGKIWFWAEINRMENDDFGPVTSTFDFYFRGIIDPHEQVTTVSATENNTQVIKEPAGRWLKLFYTHPWWSPEETVVDRVEASDGRSVQYNYGQFYTSSGGIFTALTSVVYFGDGALTATYSYQDDNLDPDGRPLIHTCVDPMFEGPMWRIAYSFMPKAAGGVSGQLASENHLSSAGIVGSAVSSLTRDTADRRTETRGDGPSRTFNFSGARLMSWTDFKYISASQTYDGAGFVNSATDRRGNTTNFISDALTGNVKTITFPLTPPDTVRATVQSVYGSAGCPDPNNRDGNNPYYLYSVTNERNHATIYSRYPDKRVRRIDYPDTSYEEFTYDPTRFFQVSTHRMTSGGTESFEYDARGLLTAYRDPYHPAPGVPTARYQYDNRDRLSGVTDARGAYLDDPDYTTNYEYNDRGQLKKTTHPIDPSTGLRYSIQNNYYPNGTLWTVTNELGHTTSFTYDDYRRPRSRTTPQRSATDTLARTTVLYYDSSGTGDDYRQTDPNVTFAVSPGGRRLAQTYDENGRNKSKTIGTGSEAAQTSYQYDNAGNLTHIFEPLQQPGQPHSGKYTFFDYDQRNRRKSATDAKNQTTQWLYDPTGNRLRETRPDTYFQRWEYDTMNRVSHAYGFMNEHTQYEPDTAGNVKKITDSKHAVYEFGYDLMSRKTSATYPVDFTGSNRTETWFYNLAGNMEQHKNPAGQVKTILYDNRNRPESSSWNWGGPSVAMAYDAASRLTGISTNNNETALAFRYDNANNKIAEDQTVVGYPTRTVETIPDADNNLRSVGVIGVGTYGREYNTRNQLARLQYGGPGGSTWYNFDYDLNGNLKKRKNVLEGGNSTNFAFDEINRITMCEQTGSGDAAFARSNYRYDELNRLQGAWRDEQSNKGEGYKYDRIGQLTDVVYDADNVFTGNPDHWMNWSRKVTYNVDPLNRVSVNANGTLTSYTPNSMNQYTGISGQGLAYDDNFNLSHLNGGNIYYDAEKRVTSITYSGGTVAQFVYDGLGRCLKRTLDGITTLIAYHGWKPFIEWDNAGNMVAYNIYGAGPDELLTRWQTGVGHLHYHLDRMGNVQFLLSEGNAGLERYTYDAFGDPTVTNWDGTGGRNFSNYGNRFMFTGREYFPSLALYDYRNRFYRPNLGRFLQSDPIGFAGGDTNLFRYCGGDPVNNTDPTGLDVVRGPVPSTYGFFDHWLIGVTDWASQGRMRWFGFYSAGGAGGFVYSAGRWENSLRGPSGFTQASWTMKTTVTQDLVVLNALYRAQANPSYYSVICGVECKTQSASIRDRALGPDGVNFNPVDPYTGNIVDFQGNQAGWEDPYTGNIYNNKGEWAGWNPNWEADFRKAPIVGYTANGEPIYEGVPVGPTRDGNSFGGWDARLVSASNPFGFYGIVQVYGDPGTTGSRIPYRPR